MLGRALSCRYNFAPISALGTKARVAVAQRRFLALLQPAGSVKSLIPPVAPTKHSPVEIRVKKADRALYIKWDDGITMKYPAELLRVESPSAEVQGHGGPGQKKARKYVNIMGLEPQGTYAILIKFDDLHETGIFSWQFLRWMGENKFALIRNYLRQLKAAGRSRDPRVKRPAAAVAPSELAAKKTPCSS